MCFQSYYISYGVYTTNVDMLELPPYIVTGECVGKPTVYLSGGRFIISIQSLDTAITQPGHIREDRLVWFGDRDAMKDVP